MADDERKYVMNCDEFFEKYGWQGASLLIEAFIERAPGFPGEYELAAKLGELVADLECALAMPRGISPMAVRMARKLEEKRPA